MSTADRARLQAMATRRRGAQSEDGYRIGPDDLLIVRIPGLSNAAGLTVSNVLESDAIAPLPTDPGSFRGGARVGPSGEVSLPLLGALQVQGRTARELEKDIAARLVAVDAPPPPKVTVLIAEYRSGTVAVMGGVERPGLYPLTRPGATLADLIWAAGGPSKEAGRVVEFSPAAMQQDLTDSYWVTTAEVSTFSPVAPGVRTPPRPEPAPFPAHDLRIEPVADRASAAPRPEPAPVAAHALRIEPAADGRRLTIPLSGVPDGLETFTLEDPPRLVIDVRGPAAVGQRLPARLPLADEVVSAVRTAIHDDTLRIVLDLRRDGAAPPVRLQGTTLVVALGERTPAPSPVPAPAAPADGRIGRVEERGPSGPLHLDLEVILDAAGRGASLLNPEVRPGDVISVLPAGNFQVDGWVVRPGSYPVTRGLTGAGAVSAAGGYLFPADPHQVVVKRSIGAGDQRLFTVDLDAIAAGRAPDFPVADGDIVQVPAHMSLLVPWGFWSFVSAIGRVGITTGVL